MGPEALGNILEKLSSKRDPHLLVGFESGDDAGIYKLNTDTALIQTVDFFTPMIDDPFSFGQVAAANALSDVYAMGGEPITAMNIIGFPMGKLELCILERILAGGLQKIEEAGALLIGGHSVDDLELKYGLSVTGLADPRMIWTNKGAQAGDRLVMTKPIGVGIVNTAIKAQMASEEQIHETIKTMIRLNQGAARAAKRAGGIHACTDITGFGLIGHLSHILSASHVSATIFIDNIPLVAGALTFSEMGLVPAGARKNQEFYGKCMADSAGISPPMMDIMYDPQTSGGLLFCLDPDRMGAFFREMEREGEDVPAIIGEIIPVEDEKRRIFLKTSP